MDSGLAAAAMISDPNSTKLVIGKTKRDLEHRFGRLLRPNEVSAYYQDGYANGWAGKDVLFIRDSPWMIVFDGNKATQLVLMKGY